MTLNCNNVSKTSTSEVWLFPAQPNMQVLVGRSRTKGKLYVEIEIYSTSLDSPDKKTLIDMGTIAHEDLNEVLKAAGEHAQVPDDLYAFLENVAKEQPVKASEQQGVL
ncbi:MAG: hypothetical protein KTR28_07725 [Micavibrio sp.]|nr:hypothetical protein [Micavibrio sp.]